MIGHPQDHLAGLAVDRPAHGLVDQGTGHPLSPVAGVDPHRHQVHASRRVGLSEDRGQADIDAALAWCTSRQATAVDAFALPGDRDTKNFFEMSGFTARLLVMHHKL